MDQPIGAAFVVRMARYNAWQNGEIYRVAASLDDADRKADRGAFFRSIHGTLCHLLWADQMWLHRFAGSPRPIAASIKESSMMVTIWDELHSARVAFDRVIVDWADNLDPRWLSGDLTWFSGAAGREITMPRSWLVVHFFNHQAHHRGQVHAMLTAARAVTADTDLPMMPD